MKNKSYFQERYVVVYNLKDDGIWYTGNSTIVDLKTEHGVKEKCQHKEAAKQLLKLFPEAVITNVMCI